MEEIATMVQQEVSTKPRRKNRCMFKDEDGRWWLDYYTPEGRRQRKLVGKSKHEAEALLDKIKVSKSQGEYVDPTRAPAFSDFCDIFMERHGQHKSYYRRNAGLLEKLRGFFWKIRLSKINAGHIEAYRLKRLDEKSSRDRSGSVCHTTIDREVEIIRAMFGKAVKWGFLSRNPASQVEDYSEDNKRERFLSTDELRCLLRATKQTESPILRPAVYLDLQTGMRKGELLNLEWSDINWEAGKILVRETKNGQPRHVPMNRRAYWLLKKLAARAPLGSGWVFESHKRDNSKAPAGSIKTAWRRALRLARIENFRFHDLRHTFASHFAMKGGDLYALAKILGHSNPKITLDRYAHLSPAYVQAQRGVMDRMYPNSEKNCESNGHQMDSELVRTRIDRS